jgi:Na+-transporting methylmalonyl-CoA/oxaloacetate decarboxylase gamma subunit
MNARTILSKTIGLIQTSLGGMAIVFAFLSFYNVFNIQAMLNVAPESIGFYLWIFIIFGLLSVISGLFLFYEQ